MLCSHLLFTWADKYDRDWHLAALRELIRVSNRRGPHLPAGACREPATRCPICPICWTALDGVTWEIRKVPYEFQVGADEMLVLTRT